MDSDAHHDCGGGERTEFLAALIAAGLELNDTGAIRWNKDNRRHPRNWSAGLKAYSSTVILILEFVTTAISTAGTSAALQAQADYGISSSFSIFAFTSMYLIGQGIGGVFFPPYSESFGRKSLYLVSTLGYCVFCAITAAVPSLGVIIFARFVMGLLSAIPTIVVAGSMEDLFNVHARVWMIFIWAMSGNVAVCIGPIYSTYIAYGVGWRWVFWIATAVTGVLLIFCLFLKETRPSLLLEREVAVLQKQFPGLAMKTLNPDNAADFRALVQGTLVRPLRLLFTEPIVMLVAFMGSVTCAIYYLFADALLVVFTSYGWTAPQASLAFIPLAVGHFLGFLTRWHDHRSLARRKAQGETIEPESKLFWFAVAAPVLAASLWWFSWTIPPLTHVHFMSPMISLIPVGFALNEFVYTLTGYLADSYTIYAASGFAGLILARAFACALILPLTNAMFTNIPANFGGTILAGLATVFCLAPVLFTKFGKRIRESSRFARHSLATYRDNQVEDDMNEHKIAGTEIVG